MLIYYENMFILPAFQSGRILDIEKLIKYRSYHFGKKKKSFCEERKYVLISFNKHRCNFFLPKGE